MRNQFFNGIFPSRYEKRQQKKQASLISETEPLCFISEKTETSGKEIANPFDDMSKISKLYLLHLICNFYIPWRILRVF